MLYRKLKGLTEIDKSLFGRRVKHLLGNPKKGCKIWVFGMVERDSNSVIIYPVRETSQKTLMHLIQQNVEKGSSVYSDRWRTFCPLNERGYQHFSVINKNTFQSSYRNVETGEIVIVHTNRIEKVWKHAKIISVL